MIESSHIDKVNWSHHWLSSLIWRKKQCSRCSSARVIHNGFSRHGKQRWLCSLCKHTFGWMRKDAKRSRQFIWFVQWMKEGYAIRQLTQHSPHSSSTLRRIIRYWINRLPRETQDISCFDHLIFDGSYLARKKGMIVLMDARTYRIVYGVYGITEGPRGMTVFCASLQDRGFDPKSITVDGNPHVIRAFKAYWPEVVIQRCLVHIQRQGLMWCRRNPKRTDAKHLRTLFLQVTMIHTYQQRAHFLCQLASWEDQYGRRIASSRETGWVFSDLKRARSMLMAALPDMFHYLDNPLIPATTNGLEGYFARLKQRYRQHRGMNEECRVSYFRWYFHVCNRWRKPIPFEY